MSETDIGNSEEHQEVATEQVSESSPQELVAPTQAKKEVPKLLVGVIVVVVIVLLVGLGLLLRDRSNLKHEVSKLSQSQTQAVDEAKQLNSDVAKLVELPNDEVPTIGTVADVNKLKQQSVGFENAKTGDKLLIYTRSQRIIVYRPETKKIVGIVQISLGQQNPADTQKKQ